MSSRDPQDLMTELEILYHKFKMKMDSAEQEFILTCTYRSQQEQDELYKQGRTKPGRIVTWVKHSKHNDRKAFDIAMIKNGKITWDEDEYMVAGKIGRELGLIWGGDYKKTKDYPHFEYKEPQ